jgi:hypothetical protein
VLKKGIGTTVPSPFLYKAKTNSVFPMSFFLKKILFSFIFLLVFVEFSFAQLQSPISSIVRCQQLISGPTVLVVTVRPGDEDFEGLSLLRINAGARIAFLHITNGESIPTEKRPWNFDLIEACRKEEAVQSARVFNAASYFLNIPDEVMDSNVFRTVWNADTLASKIAPVVKLVKPHIILFCAGESFHGENKEQNIIEGAMVLAAHQCAVGSFNTQNVPFSWQTQCIASTGSLPGQTKSYHLLKKENQSRGSSLIAECGRSCYSSLPRFEGTKESNGVTYRILEQQGDSKSIFIIDRIQITSPRLRSVRNVVRRAGESVLKREPASGEKIATALDSVSVYLKLGLKRFNECDQRALVLWKGDLDYFNARELERQVEISVNDSILTERQIFLVSIKLLSPKYRQGTNQIMFHKASKDDWVINESLNNIFDLNRDTVFRVLSPMHLSFTTPVALHGLDRLTLDEPFRFSIIHQGKTRDENAILTKEIFLQYSPRFASVVQTPIVPIGPSSQLIVDSYNYTRDPAHGILFVKDSICWSDTVHLSLMQKDEGRRDTFHLHWVDGLPAGDYSVKILGMNRPVGSFRGRTIPSLPYNGKKIGLLSDRVDSPLEEYSRLLGSIVNRMTWQQIAEGFLTNMDLLIVDRDTRIDESIMDDKVEPWIKNGGHGIVLPQFSSANRKYFLHKSIAFRRTLPFNMSMLNATQDYQAWLRTGDETIRGVIDCTEPSHFSGLVTTMDGMFVLARKQEGRGSIIISAFDLDAWIGRVDHAGFGLFTKVVSTQ